MMLFFIRRSMETKPNGIKASELKMLLKVSLPTVTQTLNILEAKGLIVREDDPADRRSSSIRLTEAGMETTRKAEEAMIDKLQGLIDYLGEEKSELLLSLLDDVQMYFNKP
jgi:DNA-binding MarR family transcriptional regulator